MERVGGAEAARQISSLRKLNLKQVLPQVDEDGGFRRRQEPE